MKTQPTAKGAVTPLDPRLARAKHWDLAFSCYEPLDLVTGGIGTYSRMLLQTLANDRALAGKNIAFFSRSARTQIITPGPGGHLEVFSIPDSRLIYGKRVERLGNEHDFFSWHLAHFLAEMTANGHSFGLFEFPDYAVEGYFPLKLRRAGLIAIEQFAIRLHSPELMLFRDNLLPARCYDSVRLTRMSRELFSYQHCDIVLYGAPAMLERVALECGRFGVDIVHKAVPAEHPYPMEEGPGALPAEAKRRSIHIGYVGRLEIRKGILRFLTNIAESRPLRELVRDLDVVFELFGADCVDAYGDSVRSQILRLQRLPEMRGRIIIHGYMPQSELKQATGFMDAFVFPSLFENYPNALLEILHTTSPILISDQGGMPYISGDLPGVQQFAYNAQFESSVTQFLCGIRPVPDRPELYRAFANEVNAGIAARYASLAEHDSIALEAPAEVPGIDFVVPFFNDSKHVEECLRSLKNVMADNDAIFVVDDCSKPEEAHALERALLAVFGLDGRAQTHRMPVNSGPSAARNAGVALGSNPLIQFLDADDHMNSVGFAVAKRYILNNPEADFVYGVQDNFGASEHIWVPRDSSAMTCLEENYTHSAILIRRSVFQASGGYDSGMRLHFEDWQFYCRLALSGYRGELLPFVTQHYRVRGGSRTFRNAQFEAFSREQVIDRSCMAREPQPTLLQGELLEMIGKYSSMIHGRWSGGENGWLADEDYPEDMTLDELCNLDGDDFIRAAYMVVLGRSADDTGLSYYRKRLHDGVRKESVIADLMASPEMSNKGRSIPDNLRNTLRLDRFIRRPVIKRLLPAKAFH
jgi:glycosyltransferase involved in cell wall biosynthesis